MNRITLAVLTAALALGAAACSSDGGNATDPTTSPTETTTPDEPAGGSDHEVSVVDNAFEPSEMTIAAGDSVTWTWENTSAPHNVVADLQDGEETPEFNSGTPTADAGTTYSYTFEEEGTWTYVCQVHPEMQGTITAGNS